MRELLIYLKLGLTPILTALLLMLNACSRSFVQEEIFSDSKDVITDIQVLEYMGYDLWYPYPDPIRHCFQQLLFHITALHRRHSLFRKLL